MSEIAYVDANVVLRWLLGKPEEQARKAENLFLNASNTKMCRYSRSQEALFG